MMTTKPKKAGKGILFWGAFLMVMAVLPLFDQPLPPGEGIRFETFSFSRLAASSSVFMKVLLVSGGAISLALCFLWYRLQGLREQRGRFPHSIGRVLFWFGTLVLVIMLGMAGQQEVMMLRSGRVQGATVSALLSILPGLLVPLVSLVLAYFLQFKGAAKSE